MGGRKNVRKERKKVESQGGKKGIYFTHFTLLFSSLHYATLLF